LLVFGLERFGVVWLVFEGWSVVVEARSAGGTSKKESVVEAVLY
jgi:hypothetical protein